jgi:hypothetical protein
MAFHDILARARRTGLIIGLVTALVPLIASAEPAGTVREAVAAGHPLVTHVVVPLCSNQQIDCGAPWAGRPADLDRNLYWGAIFGVRTWMERPRSDWQRVSVAGAEGPRLERRVYRRWVSGAPFGKSEKVEQIVVFDAIHGDRIDDAVRLFWTSATEGGSLVFADANTTRTERVLVAGYTGHNRMLDGLTLPSAPPAETRSPRATFVLACLSERTFGAPLRAAGVPILLTTTALVAPEAYLTDAVLHAIGDGRDPAGVREQAIASYVVWQKLTRATAGSMFSRAQD